jgi:methionyl-tRNA formyltransferase
VRGFTYGPGTFTTLEGKKLKIHKAHAIAGVVTALPGTLTSVAADSLTVATGDGVLKIYEVQPESRTRQSVADFLKGHPMKAGDRLGT